MHNLIKIFGLLFLTQSAMASPLSERALRLIQTGNEINSQGVVLSGQQLLLRGMFQLNDLDAAYESSKQTRVGNQLMGYLPQPAMANKILAKLLGKGYDPAIYDTALYLLDGESGFAQDTLMALNLFEESVKMYANPQSAFVAAVMRNESLVPGFGSKQRIDELITFAILNRVVGAQRYKDQYIDNRRGHLQVKNWRKWLDAQ
ncbi:MAG: hypothetical protein Ctma_1273 [Catillopecten margaritatus gill symbiont]|uniref:Sel1 repeat family protein n=1 Tax=Catillopecten margaritatus gill symbiont TaxID=3083288 RepID=A0AAU6PHT3_9GAMM